MKKENGFSKITAVILVIAIMLIAGVSIYQFLNFSKKAAGNPPAGQSNNITTEELKNATLSFNDKEQGVNDTFSLKDGKTVVFDDNFGPRGYTFAASAIGDINGDGKQEGIIGIYKGWGANRITPIIFAVSSDNGVLKQIDWAIPDQSQWNDEAAINSISISNGVISVNLLILSDSDKGLPHYEQQASVPKVVEYKLVNGKLVAQ